MVRYPIGDRPSPDLKYDDDVMRCVSDVITAASTTAVATRAAGLALPLGAAETAVEVTAAAVAADEALPARRVVPTPGYGPNRRGRKKNDFFRLFGAVREA